MKEKEKNYNDNLECGAYRWLLYFDFKYVQFNIRKKENAAEPFCSTYESSIQSTNFPPFTYSRMLLLFC